MNALNDSLHSEHDRHSSGFALIATMLMLVVLVALLGAFSLLTRIELATTKATQDSTSSFYAAEAALNARAEEIRNIFVGYNRPAGTSPNTSGACEGSNLGEDDYACADSQLGHKVATSYVVEAAGNPLITVIPPGERYQNLNAQEYRYEANAESKNPDGTSGALLKLNFKSRLVPLFQFAAFYNKDLEIAPGPAMTLSGPVHTNGDLFLNANATLAITGQITTAGNLYRGRKNCINNCSGTVSASGSNLPGCASGGTRRQLSPSDVASWAGQIQIDVPQVTVPGPEEFDVSPDALYFAKADLRLILRLRSTEAVDLTNSTTGVEVRTEADTLDAAKTALLNACAGNIAGRVANITTTFRNNRENRDMILLDVDLRALLNCIHSNTLMPGKTLADDTEGGLVFHFSVIGPNSAGINRYGVRVSNADQIYSSVAGAPTVKGLTIVSDQAVYTWGHFNRVNKKPAAIMCDTVNILSTGWTDADDSLALSNAGRDGLGTTINAAFLAATDSTWNVEGNGGNSGTNANAGYNGGLENFPRFHEDWTGNTLVYRGSFVSLNTPRHVNSAWNGTGGYYNPPVRDWNYDTSFNNAANLPPITPRFVYLRQEFFGREYSLE